MNSSVTIESPKSDDYISPTVYVRIVGSGEGEEEGIVDPDGGTTIPVGTIETHISFGDWRVCFKKHGRTSTAAEMLGALKAHTHPEEEAGAVWIYTDRKLTEAEIRSIKMAVYLDAIEELMGVAGSAWYKDLFEIAKPYRE